MRVAWRMRPQASGMVMKKRVARGSVTVTGPPRAICSWNRGSTLPFEPSTLPKRTAAKRVVARRLASDCT